MPYIEINNMNKKIIHIINMNNKLYYYNNKLYFIIKNYNVILLHYISYLMFNILTSFII